MPQTKNKSDAGTRHLERGAKPEAVFYVAPDGNDSWSGRTPKGLGSDGPLATMRRALDLAGLEDAFS